MKIRCTVVAQSSDERTNGQTRPKSQVPLVSDWGPKTCSLQSNCEKIRKELFSDVRTASISALNDGLLSSHIKIDPCFVSLTLQPGSGIHYLDIKYRNAKKSVSSICNNVDLIGRYALKVYKTFNFCNLHESVIVKRIIS